MPKILENVREQLMEEAMRQIHENGYEKTTIRSIAGACNMAVGTVYNYFESKDMLIATFMLGDWMKCLEEMREAPTDNPRDFLVHFQGALIGFMDKYQTLFRDKEAAKAFAGVFSDRHKQLRSQLAEIILPICNGSEGDKSFMAEFIAEAILTWTVAGKGVEDMLPIIEKLI